MTLRIGTGPDGGGFAAFARAFAPRLQAGLVGASVTVQPTQGAVDNLVRVARGELECGLTYADVAYEAFAGGRLQRADASLSDVQAVAVLQVTPMQLAAGALSTVHAPRDLGGKHVALGGPGTATLLVAQLLLEAFGIRDEVTPSRASLSSLPLLMRQGVVDAVFDVALYSDAIAAVVADGGRLISISGPIIERLRESRPFLRAVRLPARTYAGQSIPVPTIGLESLLVCRRSLSEGVVYSLTAALVDSLAQLGASRWSLVSLDQMPATSVPLHPGAAVYYREMELRR